MKINILYKMKKKLNSGKRRERKEKKQSNQKLENV